MVLAGPPPQPAGVLPGDSSSKVNTLGVASAGTFFSVAAVCACIGSSSTAQNRTMTICNMEQKYSGLQGLASLEVADKTTLQDLHSTGCGKCRLIAHGGAAR